MRKVRWRLIFTLIVLVCAALLAGLNMQPVDISVGVHVFTQAPLFLAMAIAFIAGTLCVLPYALVSKRRGPGKSARGPDQHASGRGASA